MTADGRSEFSVLDWIGAAMAACTALALLLFPIASRGHVEMFQDLGAQLPMLTKLVLSGWPPVVLGLLVIAGVVAGALRSAPLAQRRALVVMAFVVGALGLGVCWVALYLPIFELADSIKSE